MSYKFCQLKEESREATLPDFSLLLKTLMRDYHQVRKFEHASYWWWPMPCCWCFSLASLKVVSFDPETTQVSICLKRKWTWVQLFFHFKTLSFRVRFSGTLTLWTSFYTNYCLCLQFLSFFFLGLFSFPIKNKERKKKKKRTAIL